MPTPKLPHKKMEAIHTENISVPFSLSNNGVSKPANKDKEKSLKYSDSPSAWIFGRLYRNSNSAEPNRSVCI